MSLYKVTSFPHTPFQDDVDSP